MQTLSQVEFHQKHPLTQPMLYGMFATEIAPDVHAVVAGVAEGLCALGLARSKTAKACVANLRGQFPKRHWQYDAAWAESWQQPYLEMSATEIQALPILLVGTPFQHEVWTGLMQVAMDQRSSYSAFTHGLGKSAKYYRAVGTATGRNPISWLVPCHRIVAKDGGLHGYRWGLDIKQALLAAENSSKP
ncbi:MAG: methylated-DNA--[protein]-cysteine S-methyltransferase [Alphaproteobacteria bacterium]|nr:methylated-DNA--[protein]-cysteine S-methyltransferase [Alphaproteobacteria bacterium]